MFLVLKAHIKAQDISMRVCACGTHMRSINPHTCTEMRLRNFTDTQNYPTKCN